MADGDGQKLMTAGMSSIAATPTEILMQILEYIADDEQIWAIALVSHRLHYLALPLYLSRKACGARPSDQLVTSNFNARDALKAIRAALFRPTLTSLYFVIDCYKADAALREEIEALVGALRKLARLGEMVISFQRIGAPTLYRESEEEYSGFPGGLSNASLAFLLDAVTTVGCETVTLRHCGADDNFWRIEERLAREYGGVFKLAQRFMRKVAESVMPPPSVRNFALTSFRLHSPMAFHPYLYMWTLDALNHSPITSLSMSQHQGTSSYTWALLLPLLSLPALKHLSLDFMRIDIDTFSDFLERHPLIQMLHIGYNFHTIGSGKLHPKVLSGMMHLTAPVPWVNNLLSFPAALPSLACVIVLVHVATGRVLSLAHLEGALSSSLPRLVTLTVSLSIVTIGAACPMLAISKRSLVGRATLGNIVVSVEMYVKLYVIPPMLAARLPGWVAQFHGLRRFELCMLTKDPGDILARAALADAIREAIPEIESVKFGMIKEW